MKKSILLIGTLLVFIIFNNCREPKKSDGHAGDELERVADEVEEGAERAAEEVEGAFDDVKEELDGADDDN